MEGPKRSAFPKPKEPVAIGFWLTENERRPF